MVCHTMIIIIVRFYLALGNRFAYAPYQVWKRFGIKGPSPVPFFGNYRELAKMVGQTRSYQVSKHDTELQLHSMINCSYIPWILHNTYIIANCLVFSINFYLKMTLMAGYYTFGTENTEILQLSSPRVWISHWVSWKVQTSVHACVSRV